MLLPKPQKYSARLSSIEKISSKVYLERFELIEPKEMIFVAGQTVMLFVAPGINRSMSIASLPDEKNSITLVHDVGPMGPYSKWALAAKPGDPMTFMGPLGIFVLDKDSPRKKIFIATGTGIAPFHPMSKDWLSANSHQSSENLKTDNRQQITLYWGLRTEADIFWQKEFEELAAAHPNFKFILTLSQPTDTWSGKRGHVQKHIFSQQNLSDADYY